ncbi:MAG TPA: hypothetical protein VE344_00935 [Methylomirabilota bacterium]|nr:hypothetical protein [Methylomirabilota bacterium]
MTTKKGNSSKKKNPKLAQASLGLFSEMDTDVFGSVHDEIMHWTYNNASEIIKKLWPEKDVAEISTKEWEQPVTPTINKQRRLVGFIDLAVSSSFRNGFPWHIYFEVKSTVRPGSDIRQIKAYQFYLENFYRGPFVVVSPDDLFSDLLAEQGIKFVKYPDFLSEIM